MHPTGPGFEDVVRLWERAIHVCHDTEQREARMRHELDLPALFTAEEMRRGRRRRLDRLAVAAAAPCSWSAMASAHAEIERLQQRIHESCLRMIDIGFQADQAEYAL